MKIHNPEITGSLIFPRTDGTSVVLKLNTEGGLKTVTHNSAGNETTVKPASDFSGSFTGSFNGDGSSLIFNQTNIVSSSEQISLYNTFLETNGDNVFSGSSQVNADTITNFDTNVKAKLNTETVFSGSSQVNADTITNFDSNVKTKLNTETVISGSSQLYSDLDSRYNNELGEGVVSGSSQVVLNDADKTGFDTADVSEGTNLYYTDTRVKTKLDADTVHSGSFLGTATTANLSENTRLYYTDTRVKTKLNTETVVSGSAQVNISHLDTDGLSEGSSNLYYTDTRVKTKLNAETVISGSSQIVTLLNNNSVDFGSGTISGSGIQSADIVIGASKTTLSEENSGILNISKPTHIVGNITTTGTVDGRDVDSDGTKLDGIETSADVTDTANVKIALNASFGGSANIGNDSDTITIPGNLEIQGTTTTVDSTTVTIGDNILELNYGGSSTTGGILVKDATGSSTVSGSLLWDSTNDYWKLGKLASESEVIVASNIVTNLPAGSVSGSSQVSLGGDVTGTANDVTVIKVQGVALTSGEVTQLATIGSTTISSAQWGYLGASNQGITSTSDVTFNTVSATGDIVAYASSDERLKDNIELISNPIEKVQSLKGVTWDWNSNADELQQSLPNVGVIAQDVEKVLPQLVIDRDNGYKGVDYAKLTGLLIEAIKDQQKQIDELKNQLY